jgi:hypothetical protein
VAAVLAEVARQRPWREDEARAWWDAYDRERAKGEADAKAGGVTAGRT